MTIFFGVYCLDETDCSSDTKIMLESLDYVSSDADSLWNAEGIALGQKTVFNTPESFYEILPFYDQVNNITIVGDVRLDNRSELYNKLDIDPKEYKERNDAAIIILAYRKWGEALCENLLGDFAFVLWDGNLKRLIGCTDHLASRSLHYFYNNKKFVFATTPNPILALNDVPQIVNENKLMTMISPHAKHLFWGESWFKNIFPVQAATTISVDRNGFKKKVYWTPDTNKILSFKDEAAFAEAFREILFKAVSDRVRSRFPVTALLSGGLDSSAIVSVAARVLETQNRELQVFSGVLPAGADPGLIDERYYIDQFKRLPNVNINYITAEGKGFFSDLEELQTTIYAPTLIASHYLHKSFALAAGQHGSRALLGGGGGEMGISYHGTGCYAEFFRKMQWSILLHELKCRKKMNGEQFWQTAYTDVLKPMFPERIAKMIRKRHLDKVRTHCLQPGVVQMLMDKWGRVNAELFNVNSGGVSSSHRVNQSKMIRMVQTKAHGKADLGDVELRNPLLDKTLLEFCLAVPPDLKVKNGYKRYLVRSGLNGMLPPEIQWRTTKGPFSPDYRTRYNAQLPQVRSFLDDINLNDPVRQIVDVEQLKLWTDKYSSITDKMARDAVPEGIYLIHFLRRFPDYRL
ncbi:asparagine synthase-related protein [Mucilaginibacter ginsenosidivorans]|uniref:asparagine synthase (glutamine-hydrolyzing) n=1 Tax=Mucilaginibacter ginsenosidivorans TaxID=398053 RepID=A0A5B8UTH7_9SPHI|nr:asparagine synthase-related protein [Mucilaginibacter ginsenosidivorans]QEC62025.1 hypothetical protein FRZ54_05280 [Mucilaginibacter ginsenosidivorans]